VLALRFQRLLLLDVRDITIPVVIGVVKVGEGIVMRWTLYPHIIDPDFFVGLQIVVNDHSTRAHNGHVTNFSWLKPTALDRSKSLLPEGEGNIGHVLNARSDMGVTLTVNRLWEFSQDVQDDGNIMGSEVLGHIDVLLEQAKVESARIDVTNFPNVSGLNNLGDLTHRGRIEEGVAYHQDQALALSDFD
jgi:hypothetical protein